LCRGVPRRGNLLTLLPIALAIGCSAEVDTSCGGKCKDTEAKFDLRDRSVRDFASQDFVADGVTYTLLRVEYGDLEADCDPDEEDCSYSSYCGFVVEKVDFPLEVEWNSDADVLFDASAFCEDGEIEGCTLPGWDLPILDDEDFDDWIWDTDPDDNILVDCFSGY
jgi:hypothetical protein